MRAGREPAPLGGAEHFGEVLADLLLLEVHQAEAAKPRRINDIATRREGVHLVQGRRVLPLQVGRGNLPDLGIQGRVQRLDEGGLSDARFPGEQVDLPPAGIPEFFDAFAGQDGRVDDAVARPFVDGVERLDLLRRKFPVQVHLREDDSGRNAVHAAGDEDTVQEGEFDLGKEQGDDEIGHVHVGSDDVRLAGQVRGPPDHVVLPRKHFRDDGRLLAVGPFVPDPVADGHRIGNLAGFQPDASAEHGGEQPPLRKEGEFVVAAGIFDDGRFPLCHSSLFLNSSYRKDKGLFWKSVPIPYFCFRRTVVRVGH